MSSTPTPTFARSSNACAFRRGPPAASSSVHEKHARAASDGYFTIGLMSVFPSLTTTS